MSEPITRICIVGCSGSGKSTLARKLGEQTGLPVKHLDKMYWLPGWVEMDQDKFRELLIPELEDESWIIDGNFGRTAGIRFQRSHVIIHLNYSVWRCILGVLKRIIQTHGTVRPDMGAECPEKFDWSFMKWIMAFNKPCSSRDKLLEQIELHGAHCQLIQPRNRRQLRKAMIDLLPKLSKSEQI